MNSKVVKLAVAAVVVAGALAIGVETFRPGQTKKAYAFNAEIQANMALDLDPKAAVPIRDVQPGDFDVTWDSAGGGALKVMPGSSARIWRITLIEPGWDDAIEWSFSHLAEIRESTATSVVPTDKTPFAAVLTGEGNLAVIEINRRNENRAWLSWHVEKAISPGYSPVEVVTLQAIDEKGAGTQACAFDFDTGRVVEIPTAALHLPAEDLLAWLEQNGVDAIARMSEEGDGLVGVGLIFWTWMAGTWAGTDPVNLRQEMTRATSAPRRPLLFHEDRYQSVFPFKTREGAIGMLQLLAVDRAKRTVQFRYRMLQEEGGVPEADNDAESEQLAASVRRLMCFGRSLLYYANRHDDKLPLTFEQMKDYADSEQDYEWIVANVQYLGAGITTAEPGPFLLAYDRTLFEKGKGTHVLFLDCHVEFLPPDWLAKYGITRESQGNHPASAK
jgi:prepilin-type processing-associated H-X9-DG protein